MVLVSLRNPRQPLLSLIHDRAIDFGRAFLLPELFLASIHTLGILTDEQPFVRFTLGKQNSTRSNLREAMGALCSSGRAKNRHRNMAASHSRPSGEGTQSYVPRTTGITSDPVDEILQLRYTMEYQRCGLGRSGFPRVGKNHPGQTRDEVGHVPLRRRLHGTRAT